MYSSCCEPHASDFCEKLTTCRNCSVESMLCVHICVALLEKKADIWQVEFERAKPKDADPSLFSDSMSKIIKRVLFGRMQPYPQKKVITFNKHVKDFTFDVSYGDLDFMSPSELR